MEELFQTLIQLQELDKEISGARERLTRFEPRFEELEAPVDAIEREFEAARKRMVELRDEVRRLERAANDKRERLRRYEEHLQKARTAREDAAANVEIDLVRKAIDADEEEAIERMDESRRTELKADELERRLGAAREEVEPRRRELEEERRQVEDELAVLEDRRENMRVRLDPRAAKLYERIAAGHTTAVIAKLTPDGACGQCFGVVPIQQQSEIRRADSLIRCEACGVILYADD